MFKVADVEDDQEDAGEMISVIGRDFRSMMQQDLQRTRTDTEVSYVTLTFQLEDDTYSRRHRQRPDACSYQLERRAI